MATTSIATAARRVAKLIMVSPNNNNKFYEMNENDNGTFTVNYGRVGSRASVATYNMNQWDSKYREKVNKGYKDQTHLFAVSEEVEGAPKKDRTFDGITCTSVRDLMKLLMGYSNKSIQRNYTISADKVTRQQVEEAQTLLDKLVDLTKSTINISVFNQMLIDLFQVIPRRMSDVRTHLLKADFELKKVEEKLAEEQATMDVMRGQVEMNEKNKALAKPVTTEMIDNEPVVSLLDTMGLTAELVTDNAIIEMIKTKMDAESGKFYRAFAIKNLGTHGKYQNFVETVKNKDQTLFWHGSRNENWMSILKTGLVLRPANAVISGKMFGYGLYFADKFRKSLNYTSLRGSYWANGTENRAFLALFSVHTGNQLEILNHGSWCYELNQTTLKEKNPDYDSVFAKGGADLINNEYIVYNEAQCTVQYLVEVANT
jgi:poly [ADP-ribose] polymerase 2/3/4